MHATVQREVARAKRLRVLWLQHAGPHVAGRRSVAGVARGAQLMPTASGAGKGMTAAGATAKSCAIAENTTANDAEVAVVRLCCPNLNGPANS